MRDCASRLGWGLLVAAVLFSPIALISWIPLAIMTGVDVDLPVLRLAALALWAPIGVALLLHVWRCGPLWALPRETRASFPTRRSRSAGAPAAPS